MPKWRRCARKFSSFPCQDLAAPPGAAVTSFSWSKPPYLFGMRGPGDEAGIADVHDAAWRDAYRGVIPGRELERMVQRRGPTWWRQAIRAGTRLMVLDFAETIAGYASYGRNRMPALGFGGEIFELYLTPEYQGVG